MNRENASAFEAVTAFYIYAGGPALMKLIVPSTVTCRSATPRRIAGAASLAAEYSLSSLSTIHLTLLFLVVRPCILSFLLMYYRSFLMVLLL